MQIKHKIDSFLSEVFPDLGVNPQHDRVIDVMVKYYTLGPYKPKVTVTGSEVVIEVAVDMIERQGTEYKRALALCDQRNYAAAKKILSDLIDKNPSVSEYHRVLGQVESEQGNQDKAIDHLIDALKWDSHNGWALLMVGNIFAKYKKDTQTATKYYDQAISSNTADHISLTNAAYIMLLDGNISKAAEYINKAIDIKPDYPNALTVVGMIAEKKGNLGDAFNNYIATLKACNKKDAVFHKALEIALSAAKEIVSDDAGRALIKKYREKLEYIGEKKIIIQKGENLTTAAKMEFAENHNRDFHTVIYKESYPAVEHLIMHEMVHLDFVLEARTKGVNQLFTSQEAQESIFRKKNIPMMKKLTDMGFAPDKSDAFLMQIFRGQNTLMYNAPIDLFIEEYLYTGFPDLRPYQFLSLLQLTREGIEAVTNKGILEIIPQSILTKTRILNMVGGMQLRELYGVQIMDEYKANKEEWKTATTLYEEYLEYKNDRKPGEEYELVQHWAEDLELDVYFALVDEDKFRNKNTAEQFMTNIEEDPYGIEEDDPIKAREMEEFLKAQEANGINTAVVMFMVSAINQLKSLPIEKVKEIATEIAMQGIHGYSIDGTVYRLASVSGKKFTGYEILSWYYVSWSMAMPDAVGMLGLDFVKEYEIATKMFSNK